MLAPLPRDAKINIPAVPNRAPLRSFAQRPFAQQHEPPPKIISLYACYTYTDVKPEIRLLTEERNAVLRFRSVIINER